MSLGIITRTVVYILFFFWTLKIRARYESQILYISWNITTSPNGPTWFVYWAYRGKKRRQNALCIRKTNHVTPGTVYYLNRYLNNIVLFK